MWAETLEQIEARVNRMRQLVKVCGRKSVKYGVRVNIIARSTELEARETAKQMLLLLWHYHSMNHLENN
jgi:alkanesulfonate monooxygenase